MIVVVIRDNGRLVERVDPLTHKTTGEAQQFVVEPDARGYALQFLAKSEWVGKPKVLEVQSMSGFSIPVVGGS